MNMQSGHVEGAVRELGLTEPALLLRAAAVDEAARELLAEATAKAQHQATSHQPTHAVPTRSSGRRRR